MQSFFTDTIESKFVKSLLYNTPLPLIPTVREGSYIVKDSLYIYNAYIIKCTVSGVVGGEYLTVGDDTIASNDLLVGYGGGVAKYDIVKPYTFGEASDITERFLSKYGYYDTDTHTFLGKYLRCIRDIYGVDLMPFYNCFNYKIMTDFYLDTSAEYGYTEGINPDVKIIAIPIKFGETYTVAIDCGSNVLMKSVFCNDLGILKTKLRSNWSGNLADCLVESDGSKCVEFESLSFKRPIKYTIPITSHISNVGETPTIEEDELQIYEKNLYLIIQLPSSNTSSIVVLEGDYTDAGVPKVFNVENLEKISNRRLNYLLSSELSLLQINDKNSYAFSDRLIEYLLLNVIDSMDEIPQNIARVQLYVQMSKGIYGVWDKMLRIVLYRKYMSDIVNPKLDINGFVDRNVEKFITKGRGV